MIPTATPTTPIISSPGNDDAIRAIKLISSVLADAVIEGRQGAESADVEADAAETAEAEKTAAEADAE